MRTSKSQKGEQYWATVISAYERSGLTTDAFAATVSGLSARSLRHQLRNRRLVVGLLSLRTEVERLRKLIENGVPDDHAATLVAEPHGYVATDSGGCRPAPMATMAIHEDHASTVDEPSHPRGDGDVEFQAEVQSTMATSSTTALGSKSQASMAEAAVGKRKFTFTWDD